MPGPRTRHLCIQRARSVTSSPLCRCDRRANVIVETAVSLPIMFLMVFGTVEICNSIFLKQTVSIAAYEAARVAIIPGARQDNVRAQALEVLKSHNVDKATISVRPGNFHSLPMGTMIEVTVAAPAGTHSSLNRLFARNSSISTTVQIMKEY